MTEESMLKSVVVLTFVCIIAAALLGVTYSLTYDKINDQMDNTLKETLKQVFLDADNFKQVENNNNSYSALNGNDIIGKVLLVKSQGYSSIIKILVGINIENKITEVRILDQLETPGLGANIEKPYFYEQFTGLSLAEVALKKEGGEIDGVTGATISTRAVIAGVRAALQGTSGEIYETSTTSGLTNIGHGDYFDNYKKDTHEDFDEEQSEDEEQPGDEEEHESEGEYENEEEHEDSNEEEHEDSNENEHDDD